MALLAPHRWSWKTILLGVFSTIAVLCGASYFYLLWQIEVCFQEMRAEGLPTNAQERHEMYLVPDGVTDSTEVWRTAISDISLHWWNAASEDVRPYLRSQKEVPSVGQPWDQADEVQDYFKQLAPQLDAVYQASDIGGQAILPDRSIDESRDVCRLLRIESEIAARNGDYDHCLKSVKAILALGNAHRGQFGTIELMSWIAFLALGQSELELLLPRCQWTDDQIALLQRLNCEVDLRQEFRWALAGDCVDAYELLQEPEYRLLRTTNELELLRHYSNARRQVSLPIPEMISQFRLLDSRASTLKANPLTGYIQYSFLESAPSLEAFGKTLVYCVARQSITNIALACQRFRLKNGRFPLSLDQIDVGFFGKLPDGTVPLTDPFDGHPLRFKALDQGLLIYSIGDDGKDHGGDSSFVGRRKDICFTLRHTDSPK